ncbi:xanthine dehydrogenase small subunit [Bdellovibrio sp. KM01]|uniref:xanthine dehydrogenase small subunit n=1 Tax=Bdellovibrio sp. KM01 TaxID=2748865 RepID=UPI0015E916C3|nr:FAD binding domain-containing protein [Bdellovibrio sp. KM01]QLY27004.1 FAD binding domain-containing protein [Bdellovibrio sp. KM01]
MGQIAKRNHLIVNVNGETIKVSGEEAFQPLAQFLRNTLHKPGTKVVCAEGDCGACTVVTATLRQDGWTPLRAINSCIAPVYLFDLSCIVTVEGMKHAESLSEVQNKMREFHGGQCGFCTPGMVCSMAQLAEDCKESKQEVTEKKARNYLTGNLCRCTGYEPILKAATNLDLNKWESLTTRYLTSALTTHFQSEIDAGVEITSENKKLYMPATLSEALQIKAMSKQVRLVAGATDLGVLVNKARTFLQEILVLNKISGVHTVNGSTHGILIGAMASLTDVENFVKSAHPELKRLLHIFASPQIKNQGTLLGNILNGSPIGDSIPALMVLDAEIQLQSTRGARTVKLNDYYQGYKVFDKAEDEIATGIFVPTLKGNYLHRYFKVSLRKDLDISAVTCAVVLKLDGSHISEARVAMGGVGPTVTRMPSVEAHFLGKSFNEMTFAAAGALASGSIKPISDLRASAEYRHLVTENLFKKCFHEMKTELSSPLEVLCP